MTDNKELKELLRRTRIALACLLKLVEDGVLVRNTDGDADPIRYMHQCADLILAVKQAEDAMALRSTRPEAEKGKDDGKE